MKRPRIFVTGISTGVGKTVVSAALCQGLQSDYWKPVQSGAPTDSDSVRSLVSFPEFEVHPEGFRFRDPISPHAASAREKQPIIVKDIVIPQTNRGLIIEGAGGLLAPLSPTETIADLIAHTGAIVVVVVKHYLGSINHTLLTLKELERRNLPVAGVIISGDPNKESEEAIRSLSTTRIIATIPHSALSKESIASLGERLKSVMSFVLKGCL